jgi:hypothetical protein
VTANPDARGDMKTATLVMTAALACVALEANADTHKAAAKSAAPKSVQVEPAAVKALDRMSAYLRSIPVFQINLQTQRDDVDVDGQLITLSGEAVYKVRRPDRFTVDLALPSMTRQYYYDGKSLTVYDPKTSYYARVKAPPTIRETVQMAVQKYGATLPLEDLFTWDEGDARAKALTSAHFVGKTRVGGQAANHYAFRQPGVDWQIWIADGDKPAPLRVTLVSTRDPARPKFEADLAWNTAPQFAQNAFSFAPPPNSRAIAIHPLG